MDPFIGEIRPFGFAFVPQSWAPCNGQLLQIRQYTTLFALIGTVYGGDGVSTFGLPNLNGQLAVGAGQGTGLSNWQLGQVNGATAVTLATDTMAAHNHNLEATSNTATTRNSAGQQLAVASVDNDGLVQDALIYAGGTPNTQLAAQSLALAGGGGSHGNLMPTQVVNYCIALAGTYPYFS